jgi:putative ABC transport system permease protein
VSTVESGVREALELNSSSIVAGDPSYIYVSIDIELIELSRCMMATLLSVMMVVFALIIVVVCLLVVRFRINNSIEEDIMKIGSLKSVGYTSKQIILSVVLQFLAITALGSIIGIALSYSALPAISTVFEQQSGLKWEQGFDVLISSISLFIFLIIIALVTLVAARHIKKLSPIHALRGETIARKNKRNHLPLDKAKGRLSIVLAIKSILQNIKQNIMIAVILIAVSSAGAFGVIMYYNTAVDLDAFKKVPGFEICNAIAVLNPEMDQTSAIETIKNMDSVRKVQYLDESKIKIDGSEVTTFIMDTYSKRETVLVYEGRYPKNSGEITLAGVLADRLGKKVNDTVTVRFGDNEKVFKVVGLSNGAEMGGLNSSILVEDFKQLNPNFKQQALYIYLEQGKNAEEFIEDVSNKLDKEILLGTTNFDKALEEGMASYQSIVGIMGVVMLIITILVVALVLYFMISSTIIRKRRDLGIQKAIGFTTIQLMNQISISFIIPVIISAVIGSILGALYTNPLLSVFMKGMGIMKAQFIVDYSWVIGFGIAVVILSYLLSMLITLRIRKISAYSLVTE